MYLSRSCDPPGATASANQIRMNNPDIAATLFYFIVTYQAPFLAIRTYS